MEDRAAMEEKWYKDSENRHAASIKWRKEKAGKNPIKLWFYLGRYHKAKNEYSAEQYQSAPFDKIAWRRFKSYCKKLEMKGVKIRRSWLGEDAVNCRIYKSRYTFESPYKVLSYYWLSDILKNICSILVYNPKVCRFDFFDIYENLIVNLTIKGLYFGLHGFSINSKEQMHECWVIREKLLKAYQQDNWASYSATKACEKSYGCSYSPKFELIDGKVEITNAPSKEVEDYYNEQYMKSLNDTTISSDAFNELAKYINDLWD